MNDTDSTPAGLGARLRVSLSSLWARAATLASLQGRQSVLAHELANLL